MNTCDLPGLGLRVSPDQVPDPAVDKIVRLAMVKLYPDPLITRDRLVLSFRDAAGHTGTLSLAQPATMSVFEVDPRNRPDKGQGPSLYKEWKLSAPAAGRWQAPARLDPGEGGADPGQS